MDSTGFGKNTILRAVAVYLFLWMPALLVALLIAVASALVFRAAPMWSAISFLLVLPAVLIGLKSFRVSAITMTILVFWDIVTTTWPHFNLGGLFDSLIDIMLLVSAGLAILVAAASPFDSIVDFARHLFNR